MSPRSVLRANPEVASFRQNWTLPSGSSADSKSAHPHEPRGTNSDGDLYARLDGLTAQPRQQQSGCERADLVERLQDSGQGRPRICASLEAVEPDDCDVVRHSDTEFGQSRDATDCVPIGRKRERCHRHGRSQELFGNVAPATLAVVACVEEPLRFRLETVRNHRQSIRIVAGAHVGLDEVGRVADARVPVPDEVMNGLGDSAGIVGRRRRCREAVDLITGQDDRLAGRFEFVQVAPTRRSCDRDHSVEVAPCRRGLEVGRYHDLIAVQPRIERLDHDDVAADSGDLASDSCNDLAVVETAGNRRENPDRDRCGDLESLRVAIDPDEGT